MGSNLTNPMLSVRVEVKNDSCLPGFGAYLAGSAPKGTAVVSINFTALFSAIADAGDALPVADWKQIVSDTIVHELLHAVEDILEKAFSEVDIEESIRRARATSGLLSSDFSGAG